MQMRDSVGQKGETLMDSLHTNIDGLSQTEARQRLSHVGPNTLPKTHSQAWRLLLRQCTSPFFYLLLVAAGIAFGFGEKSDALMILLFLTVNVCIGFFQEYQSEKSLAFLETFLHTSARVRRDGQPETIDSSQLVPGDILVVEVGDRLQADVRWIETEGLLVDESILTGEAVPVRKITKVCPNATEPYQALNIGFTGTTVVEGRGVGIVYATGKDTQIGTMQHLAHGQKHQGTFEKGLRDLSYFLLKTMLVMLSVVFLGHIFFEPSTSSVAELFIFTLALAVSIVPEALPVVTTVTLSKGARSLAKKHVVVKHLSAIEDLGSLEVLCTDKTGTLTENRLTLVDHLAKDPAACLHAATLASPFLGSHKKTPNNAFDLALWDRCEQKERTELLRIKRCHEQPFNPAKRWNSVVVEEGSVDKLIVRGAPEEILALSEHTTRLAQEMQQWVKDQGHRGRRVIAVAQIEARHESIPKPEDGGLEWLGLLAFEDPIKPSAVSTVQHAHSMGVQIKMLTGDGPEVAYAVGRAVGLCQSMDEVMTGKDWLTLSPKKQVETAQKYAVFARTSPQEKFQILQALQQHQAVGFLGEGINDAPALRTAEVGIVVHDGADVARDAADIILLHRSLEVIVDGIKEGRRVFANTLKYVNITLSSNIGNFFSIAVASFFLPTLPLLPLQILLLNLLSDYPMIAIATDHVDSEDIRIPRSYNMREIARCVFLFGIVSSVFDALFFLLFSSRGASILQTNWFIGSTLTEIALIYSLRSHLPFLKAKHPSAFLATLSVTGMLVAFTIPFTSIGQNVFHFTPPNVQDIVMIIALISAYFLTTESVKHFTECMYPRRDARYCVTTKNPV